MSQYLIIQAALLASIVLGTLMILGTIFVFVSQKMLGWGGIVMTVLGTVLVGLSVWSTIQVNVGPDGISLQAEIQQLQNQIADQTQALNTIQADIEQAATMVRNIEDTAAEIKTLQAQIDGQNQQLMAIQKGVSLSVASLADDPALNVPELQFQLQEYERLEQQSAY